MQNMYSDTFKEHKTTNYIRNQDSHQTMHHTSKLTATASTTRKSTTGVVLQIAGVTIATSSKTQQAIARSSVETKFYSQRCDLRQERLARAQLYYRRLQCNDPHVQRQRVASSYLSYHQRGYNSDYGFRHKPTPRVSCTTTMTYTTISTTESTDTTGHYMLL
eukprot:4586054-Amphidinium_carterae.1